MAQAALHTGAALGPRTTRLRAATRPAPSSAAPAGPASPKPVETYKSIDARSTNRAIMALFRQKLAAALGRDAGREGYDAIIELTLRLNSQFPTARQTQAATRAILKSLFPPWLPGAFKVLIRNLMTSRAVAWLTLRSTALLGPAELTQHGA